MLILKPVILCITVLILIIILKSFSSEFVPIILLSFGIIVIIYISPYIANVLNLVSKLENSAANISPIIKITIKVIAIALICEFTSQICDDSGQSYLSAKINLVGKIIILSIVAPLVLNFVEYIIEMSYDI